MRLELNPQQRAAREEFRAFVAAEIAPHAGRWDRAAAIPMELVDRLRERGYLGSNVPAEYGGPGRDNVTYGLLTEEIGKGCSSVRSLLTVHDMVAHVIGRWGSQGQRERYLPALAKGDAGRKTIGAFCLSEPNAGSDAKSVETVARDDGDAWVLDGRKKWTTFGQIANLFLVLAQLGEKSDGKPTAFLVERDLPGVTVRPLPGITGTRASMLAEVFFEGCRVPKASLIGKPGFGVSAVMSTALDHGRYSVAWGAVGLAQACLDASRAYAAERRQFGVPIADHQLVRRMLTNMIAEVRAARLLCLRAGWLRDTRDPGATGEIWVAKYFASTMATRAALDAVQIHGANGCSEGFPVERYLRDSRVLEIIEGSTQIQQITIPLFELQEL
ncbi:MAG TPA: acyl-CoA dehydrogenase family protein [Thermoanaerobaculia bacterium]